MRVQGPYKVEVCCLSVLAWATPPDGPESLMVDVPVTVLRMPPAVVRVRPEEEKSPPCPANAVPLEKVLVAVLVWRILPPPMVMPEEVAKSPPMRMPLKIVDVEFTTKFPTSWRERREPGVVVPMPTLPSCITLKRVPCAPTKSVEVAISA